MQLQNPGGLCVGWSSSLTPLGPPGTASKPTQSPFQSCRTRPGTHQDAMQAPTRNTPKVPNRLVSCVPLICNNCPYLLLRIVFGIKSLSAAASTMHSSWDAPCTSGARYRLCQHHTTPLQSLGGLWYSIKRIKMTSLCYSIKKIKMTSLYSSIQRLKWLVSALLLKANKD